MGTKHLTGRQVRWLLAQLSPRTVALLLLMVLLAAGGGVAASVLTAEPRAAAPAPGEPATARPVRVEPRGLERSAPVRLLIPTLDVAAEVVALTLEEGGLTAPSQAGAAGWYEGGTSPGEPGSAVIVGHARLDSGGPAVFAGLDRLGAGDRVTVVREDGSSAPFTVDRVATSGQEEPVYRGGGRAELRLVQWHEEGPDASPRLVVFATFAR